MRKKFRVYIEVIGIIVVVLGFIKLSTTCASVPSGGSIWAISNLRYTALAVLTVIVFLELFEFLTRSKN